jgi:hypothetical protein
MMSITDVLTALVVLVPMGLLGSTVLWRAQLRLDPLEIVAYGVPIGWMGTSLVLLGATTLIGRIVIPVIVAGLTLALVSTWALWATRPRPARVTGAGAGPSAVVPAVAGEGTRPPSGLAGFADVGHMPHVRLPAVRMPASWSDLTGDLLARRVAAILTGTRDRVSPLPLLVLGTIFLVWSDFWTHVISYEPELTFAFDSSHFTADWPLHLGDVASMVYGDNFPMLAPRFAGEVYSYHYLATFTAALTTKLGVLPGYALAIHSWFGMGFCLLALYAFARRVLRHSPTAVLATALFYLGGSFAWLLTVRAFNGSGSLWDTLRHHAWDFPGYDNAEQFAWNQVLGYQIIAQRSFLYGIAPFLLILTLLWLGLRHDSRRHFVAAAVVTGMLPYANGSVTLVLPLILPFLALLFPRRAPGRSVVSWWRAYPVASWVTYGVIALALVGPQVLAQQGSGASGLQVRWNPGFDLGIRPADGDDPWWWYALKNFGFLLLLVPAGLSRRDALTSEARRLLLAVMPLFVLAQLFTFQPLTDDNAKVVILWYLAGAVAAAAGLASLWRRARSAALRTVLVVVTTAVLLNGILIHVEFLARNSVVGVSRADELVVGQRVRDETFPHAFFLTGQWNTNPVLMIGGRSILLGWNIQVYPLGYDAAEREQAVAEIFRLGPDTTELIDRYGIDYVAISSVEIRYNGADLDGFAARYPLAIEEGDFHIFAVSAEAIALVRANGVPTPTGGR